MAVRFAALFLHTPWALEVRARRRGTGAGFAVFARAQKRGRSLDASGRRGARRPRPAAGLARPEPPAAAPGRASPGVTG